MGDRVHARDCDPGCAGEQLDKAREAAGQRDGRILRLGMRELLHRDDLLDRGPCGHHFRVADRLRPGQQYRLRRSAQPGDEHGFEMGLDVGEVSDVIGPIHRPVVAERDPAVETSFAERVSERSRALAQLAVRDRGVFPHGLGRMGADAHAGALPLRAAPGSATSPASAAAAKALSRYTIQWQSRRAVMPLGSKLGESSAISSMATPRRPTATAMRNSSRAVSPPGSGAVVPGAQLGSIASLSSDTYTASVPDEIVSRASSIASSTPRAMTSLIGITRTPRSRARRTRSGGLPRPRAPKITTFSGLTPGTSTIREIGEAIVSRSPARPSAVSR